MKIAKKIIKLLTLTAKSFIINLPIVKAVFNTHMSLCDYMRTFKGCQDYDLRFFDDMLKVYGSFVLLRKIRYHSYLCQYNKFSPYDLFLGYPDSTIQNYYQYILGDEYKLRDRDNKSFYQRMSRLRHRLEDMFNRGRKPVFLTLTFSPKYIGLSDTVKRKYVQQYLNSCCWDYVANVDYGSKNGRIHYHAVCEMHDYPIWHYGLALAKYIRAYDVSKKTLSIYITKFTRHAYKTSTQQSARLLYSRKDRAHT